MVTAPPPTVPPVARHARPGEVIVSKAYQANLVGELKLLYDNFNDTCVFTPLTLIVGERPGGGRDIGLVQHYKP